MHFRGSGALDQAGAFATEMTKNVLLPKHLEIAPHPLQMMKKIRTRSTTTSHKGQNSGILDFLQCILVRNWPPNVEKIARFPGGEKCAESCDVSRCRGFFGPEKKYYGEVKMAVRKNSVLAIFAD